VKRTLDDADSAVAFEILRSQQDVIGNKTLDIAGEGQSLVQAMTSPDRKVRFESAFALAAARPSEGFSGSDSVVPLLGEALSQTGKPTALVIAANTDVANANAEPLKAAGYEVVTSTTASDAGKQAMAQPAIDVVVFDGTMDANEVEGILTQLATSPKLKGSARLALVNTTQSPFEERKAQDPLLSTAVAKGPEEIKAAVDAARTKGGALAIDPAIATDYALRAAAQLKAIGTTGGVYDLKVVKPTLLRALSDPRPELVTAVAQVFTQFDDADGQQALLARAAAAETPELRIALYKALAANAKQFGNKLGDTVAGLEKTVTDEADLNVRNAAAEARGALNLPAEQAKTIILKQVQR
jgi:DNA-binding NarL/FixJ family response regulator